MLKLATNNPRKGFHFKFLVRIVFRRVHTPEEHRSRGKIRKVMTSDQPSDLAHWHEQAGRAAVALNNFVDAETHFSNAIDCDRFNADFYAKRANVRYLQGNYPDAEIDCVACLQLDPSHEMVYLSSM